MLCPTCKSSVDMSEHNRWRPFCSERCRLIDLGKWAGEEYRVPGKEHADTEHPDDFTKKRLH